MRIHPIPCFGLAEDTKPSPCTSWKMIPDKPHKCLDFWYIAPHDRETLTKLIMPYMAARLPRKYLLQSLLEKHNWACEILGPTLTQKEEVSLAYLQHITTSFWQDPRRAIAKLVRLTRILFFTLLRYIYRMRFFERSRTYQSDLDVPEIQSCETRQYISELTERDVYRLTCIPYKYGAYFYRRSYKIVKQCPTWKTFCARIQTFCDTVGIFASTQDPEQSLEELQKNLTSVMSQQAWLRTTAQLDKTAILAHSTASYVKEIDRRIASAGSINLKLTKAITQQLGDLQLQCNKLQSAHTTLSHTQQSHSKLSAEIQVQRRVWEKELQGLRNRIESSEERSKRDITMITEQIKEDRSNSSHLHIRRHECPSVEALVACRWLLEHLPAANSFQQGLANRWRLFWQEQWKKYKKEESCDDHPLRGLVRNEKFHKVGKGLYSTLSNFLHEYGCLRISPLHPDVQKVVETISPLYYKSNGQIDIEAERSRWLRSG